MLRVIAVTIPLSLCALSFCAGLALPAFAQQNCDAPGAMCGGNKNKRAGGGGIKGTQMPTANAPQSAPQYLISHKDRATIKQHFAAFMAKGNCPPDLQKNASGCVATMARSWAIGQALPAGIAAHPLVDALQTQLAPPPAGYRYARVSSDVLLLATSGNMVMDDFDFLAK